MTQRSREERQAQTAAATYARRVTRWSRLTLELQAEGFQVTAPPEVRAHPRWTAG